MGSAALIGMILSAFGVFLVWRTFNATRESNEIIRDTANRQLRAYITARGASVKYQLGQFHIRIEIINTGQTPAKDVQSWVQTVFNKAPFDEGWLREAEFFSKSDLGAGADLSTVKIDPPTPNSKILDEIRSGSLCFWIHGIVKYLDIFDQPHTTIYRYIVLEDAGWIFRAVPTPDGNSIT